jgi:hypothetical protein
MRSRDHNQQQDGPLGGGRERGRKEERKLAYAACWQPPSKLNGRDRAKRSAKAKGELAKHRREASGEGLNDR